MSRIGKKPITLPSDVKIEIDENNYVTVTGPKGKLARPVSKEVTVKVDGNQIEVLATGKGKNVNAFHGLYRQLINNMVEGVSKGFSKSLTINGVGYKASMNGTTLVLNLGLSHPVEVKPVDGITITCDKTTVTVSGIDKEAVGQFAAKIRDLRPVEPYHAYGIYYSDEVIRRKEIKSGKK